MKAHKLDSWALAAAMALLVGCMATDSKSDSVSPVVSLGSLHPAGMASVIDVAMSECDSACGILNECGYLVTYDWTLAECGQYCELGYLSTYMLDCIIQATECTGVQDCM